MTTPSASDDSDLVEAFLTASRALVGVAVRSLNAGDDEVTLPQHRALVLLAAHGPQRMADLATLLGVNSSTATRQCDRLQRRGLIRRQPSTQDRRTVRVSLTDAGQELVRRVTAARRSEISTILRAMPVASREQLVTTLLGFAEAAGEVPDQNWSLGWGTDQVHGEPTAAAPAHPTEGAAS
ncbi:MarR family transcriptional regulator [Actinoplanes sp. KI2]|uniref:MarR family winged helix-turn-helix transcriptional regulator n=1 Tax=Actinoplanes sp. KI2 TaxID=2983315 RepID=UPI0021D5EF9D|nr:MarR family transcriptional regulator [Actinoplanes sp. KI2]MCU7730309.1 MarR family transcriptional regulator [Actinoplanes sp. KI2]